MRNKFVIWFCVISSVVTVTSAWLLPSEVRGKYSHACLPSACNGCGLFVYYPLGGSTFRISCPGARQTSFPIVSQLSSVSGNALEIDFSNNMFTTVPVHVFRNIPHGVPKIKLYLQSNAISSIDANAFDEISAQLTVLELSNNHLSNIPSAVTKLSQLTTLRLKRNPITSIDSMAFSNFGHSLIFFDISIGQLMSDLTTPFRSLTKLNTLEIYDITKELSDPTLFDSFANTLFNLQLYYRVQEHGPHFRAIPPAVTHVRISSSDPNYNRLNVLALSANVYCTCNLAYLKNWHVNNLQNTQQHVFMKCPNNPNMFVIDYIKNLGHNCH